MHMGWILVKREKFWYIYIEVIDKMSNNSLGTFEIERHSNLSNEEVINATGIIGSALVE